MQILISKYNLIFISLLLLYTIISTSNLLLEPPIWPDEVYLADIANNILESGNWGTNLWGDVVLGARLRVYWYPPLYLLMLAGLFKATGISILNQRIFSVFIGGAFLFVYYLLGKSITTNFKPGIRNFVVFSSIILLILDNIFQKGTRIGRPEILVLFFVTLGFYLFSTVFNTANPKKNLIYFLAGLSLGLAAITHLLSGLFFAAIVSIILIREKIKIFKLKQNIYLFLGFVIPLLLWIVGIFPNYYTLIQQLSLQKNYHELVISHIQAVFKYGSVNERLTYIIYISIPLLSLIRYFINKNLNYLLLVFVLFVGLVICVFGKLEWYSIYLLPFSYLLGTTVSYDLINAKRWTLRIIGIILLIAFTYLAITNIMTFIQSNKKYAIHQQDYNNLEKEIQHIIPSGKTLYLSSVPDLYFHLRDKYSLYQFPPFIPPSGVSEYLNLLNQTDYIVINLHLETMYVGGLLTRYMDLNKASEHTVGKSALYQVQIIELIPRNQRYKP